MGTELRDFFGALNEQEGTFIPALAADNLGLVLKSAVGELDWYAYNLARESEVSHEMREHYYLIHLGVSRLIRLELEARGAYDVPAVTFRRERDLSLPVLEIVAGLGMVQHGRRMGQLVRSGRARLDRAGANRYLVTLPESIPDAAYYERSVAEHYRSMAARSQREVLESESGRRMRSKVDELLNELVFPFERHYIGYGADPRLDYYFFGNALKRLEMCEGFDSFNYATEFGGVAFQKYYLGLALVVSIALKHEGFAEALAAKEPEIRLENLLTISAETTALVESIRDALNLFGREFEGMNETDLGEARLICEVLSIGRENIELVDRPGCPLPPLIRYSDVGVIHCQAGALGNPIAFLLDSLRHRFRRDYDRNQGTREKSMQAAMRRMLDGVFSGLEYRENVMLKTRGKVMTDIDLVVAEPLSGTLVLVQLKHQDPYGMDLDAENLRTDRLKKQVSRWLAATGVWLDGKSAGEVAKTLRLGSAFSPTSLHRLVIARHYCYPTGEIPREDDVAFGNWDMLYNAVATATQSRRRPTLSDVVQVLRDSEAPGGPQQYASDSETEWNINELSLVVRQQGRDSGDVETASSQP